MEETVWYRSVIYQNSIPRCQIAIRPISVRRVIFIVYFFERWKKNCVKNNEFLTIITFLQDDLFLNINNFRDSRYIYLKIWTFLATFQ